ncbi:MAG: DUF1848 domain-containing protein [Magnetospirillum sp. WYHS-4]
MIVSASYRTDIPAFYGPWLMKRLQAGFCRTASPYGGPPATVDLSPAAVDGFVFWTRNLGPFLPNLAAIRAAWPFVVQYTITGYPRALDAATIDPDAAVAHLHDVARAFGPRAGVWRYDPIVFTSLTPPEWHRATFARLAGKLGGAVDEVVVSVAQIYRKTARNLGAAAKVHGFEWWDPPAGEKQALLRDLAGIAAEEGLRLAVCAQPDLLAEGVGAAACIDLRRLSDLAGRDLAVPRKPHRPDCGCWASRDIGSYDSCPQGCAYCYAVGGRAAAKTRLAAHDPDGEFCG